jgi:hypothetical protein
VERQEIVARSLAACLERHFSDIGRSEFRIQAMKFAQPFHIWNGLDIKNQDRRHFTA